MTLYLQMNGSTDSLITNFGANTTDKIVMDVLIDNPQLNSYAYLLGPTNIRVNNGNLQFGTGVTGYAFGTRTTLTIDIQANLGSAQAITSIFYRGTSGGGYNGYSTKGKIYDVKYYSAGVLVAHYDMSTGTVQDISSNGNHATLTGGTWVDDGAGGGSTPTSPPNVTIVSVDNLVISDEPGINQSTVRFKFDTDVTAWEVRVIGTGQGTGTIADSGATVSAGTEITAIIDWTELYQEGDNRINIYGENVVGWTPYEG